MVEETFQYKHVPPDMEHVLNESLLSFVRSLVGRWCLEISDNISANFINIAHDHRIILIQCTEGIYCLLRVK
jgi:hypothetical protein